MIHWRVFSYHSSFKHILTLPALTRQRSLHLSIPQCYRTAPVTPPDYMPHPSRPILLPPHPLSLWKSLQPPSTTSPPFPSMCISLRQRYPSRHHTVCKNFVSAAPRPFVPGSSASKNKPSSITFFLYHALQKRRLLEPTANCYHPFYKIFPYTNHTHSPPRTSIPPPLRSPLILSIHLRHVLTQFGALVSHVPTVSALCHCQSFSSR